VDADDVVLTIDSGGLLRQRLVIAANTQRVTNGPLGVIWMNKQYVPHNILCVGKSEKELDIFKIYSCEDFNRRGAEAVIQQVLYNDLCDVDKLHMSFDMGVVNVLGRQRSLDIVKMIGCDPRLMSMAITNATTATKDIILSSLTYNDCHL